MTNLGFPAAEDPTNKKKINSVKQTATQVFCRRKNDQQHEERRKQPATPSKPVTYTFSAPFTSSHPTLNELEIPVEMVLTFLKQLDIKWNSRAAAEGNRWPDLTVPDHVIQQILAARHFPGDWKLANIVPIFKKGKRDFVENCHPISMSIFPFSLSSPKFSSAAFWRVYEITYPTSSVANSMAF